MWGNRPLYTYKQLMITHSIKSLHEKSKKVIISCQNKDQILGAIKYIEIFNNYCTKNNMDPELIKGYYTDLQNIIKYKTEELNG